MGTWSKPLFVRVTGVPLADLRVETAAWSEKERAEWFDAGFLQQTKTSYSLEEFFDSGLDCHKVLDYLGKKQVTRWLALCEQLRAAGDALETIEFHFYSSDAGFPYMLKYTKGLETAKPVLALCQPPARSPTFIRYERRTWSEWYAGVETERGVFDDALYRRNVLDGRVIYWDQALNH